MTLDRRQARQIKAVHVIVHRVDRNDDTPGLIWLVTLCGPGSALLTVAAFDSEASASIYGYDLAQRNDWSF